MFKPIAPRKRLRVVCLILLAGLACGFLVFRPKAVPEPLYQGRTLSSWLLDLDYSGRPQDLAAKKAVAQMRTNILPFLAPLLRAHDSGLKGSLRSLLSKQSLVKVDHTPAEVLQERASSACRVLGPAAACYAPELVAMMDHTNRTSTAWCGLVALMDVKSRTDCVPELTKGLTNPYHLVRWLSVSELGNQRNQASLPALILALNDSDRKVREAAVDAMAHFSSNKTAILSALTRRLADMDPQVRDRARTVFLSLDAVALVPALGRCLTDPNVAVRVDAAKGLRYLGQARSQASTTVPLLIGCLADTNAQVRAEAALTLGNLGAAARIARDKLEERTNDEDPNVREKARQALKMIPLAK